ncbi:hypothetical protein BHT94_00205 [Bacillus licheniformis]|uniref:Integral inner membrane protein n=1 Tax=Bacillus cabrialesii subsp. tritici TaxID=2944916 RepID=A0ABT9DHR2_9BACI|nr:hypothetical protein [Bacillus cabrialesii]MDO8224233.1 hypothetical protein [Bacillus cabrialesii subsp. tritici]OLQ57539.1 hypothetical protein BHT94_00205 [Bacillus licheniformis]
MDSFLGLLKKDLKLSKIWLLAWICGIIFLLVTGHIIASHTKQPLVIFGFFVAVAFFLVFLSPVFVFYHLHKEGKSQLWLYNPNGGFLLLSSKLAASLLYQFLIQLALTAYGIWIYHMFSVKNLLEHHVDMTSTVVLLNVYGLISSLYMSVTIVVFWTVFHSLKNWRGMRWAVMGLLAAVWYFFDECIMSPLLESQKHFWPVTVYCNFDFNFHNVWRLELKPIHLSVLGFPIAIIITIILLLMASKLLDRKVEV